jgi:hypothetical protein
MAGASSAPVGVLVVRAGVSSAAVSVLVVRAGVSSADCGPEVHDPPALVPCWTDVRFGDPGPHSLLKLFWFPTAPYRLYRPLPPVTA